MISTDFMLLPDVKNQVLATHFLISFGFCRVALSRVVPFNKHIADVLCVLQLILPHHSALLSLQSKRHRFSRELSRAAVVLRDSAIFFLAPPLYPSLSGTYFFKSIELVTAPCLYNKK